MAVQPNLIGNVAPKFSLDRIDFEILTALQNDARLSNKELAARVHLAPSSCLERVRRLRRDGVLTGFHARVQPLALGIGLQAMVAVQLGHHSGAQVEAFFEGVGSDPAVIAIYYLAGATDFLVHVAVRDTDALRRFVVEVMGTRPEISHVETSLIFDHKSTAVLPCYHEPEA